jgi:hypothetical protein
MQTPEQSADVITNDIPHIKQVTIKGLFGKKDIDWTLGDVNVLVNSCDLKFNDPIVKKIISHIQSLNLS